jgi:hypothetical protein
MLIPLALPPGDWLSPRRADNCRGIGGNNGVGLLGIVAYAAITADAGSRASGFPCPGRARGPTIDFLSGSEWITTLERDKGPGS